MTPLLLGGDFAILRPYWLLMLPFLALVPLLRGWRAGAAPASFSDRGEDGPWTALIDPDLRRHLLQEPPCPLPAGSSARRSHAGLTILALLGVVTLAGPALRQPSEPPVPVRPALTRLLLVDLSASFGALPAKTQDRVRRKLQLLLAVAPIADNGLIVHNDAAYLVVPPTTDAGSVARWIHELAAEAMPNAGLRGGMAAASSYDFGEALQLAGSVLRRHGGRPELVWISATRLENLSVSLQTARQAGVLPEDTKVTIVQPAATAEPGAGSAEATVIALRDDERDLAALIDGAVDPQDRWRPAPATSAQSTRNQYPIPAAENNAASSPAAAELGWRDVGPLLLLTMLPVAAWQLVGGAAVFRRKNQFTNPAALMFALLATLTADDSNAAAGDRRWQGIAAYRAGDFAGAAAHFAAFDDADSLYNRANALARLGRLQEALTLYDKALQQRPGDADFQHNRELVARLLQSPPPPAKQPPAAAPRVPPSQLEAQRAAEQWLRRVPDVPPTAAGDSLLRRKLLIDAASRLPRRGQ